MTTAPTKVRAENRNGIALITLNDPPANTYSYEMMRQLDDAILQARMDENVEVIVLTGAGEKFFCAGADIQMLASVTPTYKYYFCLHANETLSRLEETPKLVIAAINGHCVGGGLEVAMATDIRIARKDAGKRPRQRILWLSQRPLLPGQSPSARRMRLTPAPEARNGSARGIPWSVAGNWGHTEVVTLCREVESN